MQGHIHKRVRTCKSGRKSTLWYVVVDLPRGAEGERRQKWHGGFPTKKAAEAVRARLVHQLTTGFYVEPSSMQLSEWLVDHWLPVHQTRVKKTTLRAYRAAIKHHISPYLGGVALGKLTSQILNLLYLQLLADGRVKKEGGLAPATVNGVHVVLRKALADAEDAGLIPRNPAKKASRRDHKPKAVYSAIGHPRSYASFSRSAKVIVSRRRSICWRRPGLAVVRSQDCGGSMSTSRVPASRFARRCCQETVRCISPARRVVEVEPWTSIRRRWRS